MSEETKSGALVQPGSPHSLEERRAVTDDVLELSGHELQKALSKRVEDAKKRKVELYEGLGGYMHSYNDAKKACWESVMLSVSDDIRHSFQVLNRYTEDDDDSEILVEVEVREDKLLFGLEDMKSNGYYHLGESYLSGIRACYEGDIDFPAQDISIPFVVTVSTENDKHGDVDFELRRQIDVTPSMEYHDAFVALVEASNPYFESIKALEKAEKDLKELPANMKELKMQVISNRIKDLGGEGILSSVLASVEAIKQGQDISGLRMALPSASTFDGKADVEVDAEVEETE